MPGTPLYPQTDENQALAKRIFLKNLDDCIKFPKYFEIETVNACNARCVMCSVKEWTKRKDPIMRMDLFHKFVEEIKEYSGWVETVCLNRDGEPLLDKEVPKRIALLKEIGIRKVTLSTNGQLLTSETATRLIEADLDDIMVSIDGITKETFEKIRHGLNYDTVLENTLGLIRLRNSINPGMIIRIRMVVMPENMHEIEPWMKHWSKQIGKNDRIYAKPLHTWGNQVNTVDANPDADDSADPCVSPFSSMVIHVDGTVPMCGIDFRNKYLMGNLEKESIREIWSGEGFSGIRMLHAQRKKNTIPFCYRCPIWETEKIIDPGNISGDCELSADGK
ncbi:MAG: radical SAM protein [Nitrospirae bacterium]|nr:radical SAM protein [Nitrospirota bacterium]